MSDLYEFRHFRDLAIRVAKEALRLQRENEWLRTEPAKVRALSPSGVYR